MNDRLVTDESLQKALDFLRDTARDLAEAKADRIYAEEYRKSLKAILMREYLSLPVGAQEREAYAHERYVTHLDKIRAAVVKEETLKAQREAAAMRIEAWRSEQANYRAMKI